MILIEEEFETMNLCKEVEKLGRKEYVAHICQTRDNPFIDSLLGKSWFKKTSKIKHKTIEGLERD
jgi:hypothetical protein